MILRPYQNDVADRISHEWREGNKNVLAVLPCAAGKTVIFGNKISKETGVTFTIAHRQELIFQISMALAKFGVVHAIHAPKKIIKWAVRMHLKKFGRHFYNPQAKDNLAGVLTLQNHASTLSNAINQTQLWVTDEGHHVCKDNVWGKTTKLFPPSCRGLGVTATPLRADGRGLGRHADGVYDTIVEGPGMRDLINQGYLTDYRIFAPKTFIDLSDVPVTRTGDFSKPKLVASVRKSQIIGDVAKHYLRIAPGKIGVTFVPDIETGKDMTANFNAAGIPTELVHAKTPYKIRQEAIARLAKGDLKELVNVDIFGEGFDLPAIEVCSFARPTASYGLFIQQFGRGLRLLPGKESGIIIDHVGNVLRHAATRGLPDSPQVWTLDAREKRSNGKTPGLVPVRTCVECTAVYESYMTACPFCGHMYRPESRGSIAQVEGDLLELTSEVLASMQAEIDRINAPVSVVGDKMRHAHAPGIAIAGAMKNHRLRQEAQVLLRAAIAEWAGYQRAAGQSDSVSYRRFLCIFGIDVMTAQTIGRRKAEELTMRIKETLI